MELCISDLDGTLLNSKQELSENTINILNYLIESKKIDFTIATARSKNTAWPIINRLKLIHPIVFHNGVFVYDPVSKKYIKENYIEYELLYKLIHLIESHDLHPIVFSTDAINGDKVYYSGIYNYGEKLFIQSRLKNNDKRFSLVNSFDAMEKSNIIAIIIIDSKENIDSIYENIKDNYKLFIHKTEDIYSKFYWLEITNAQANKKAGVKFIKSLLKITKTTCFGDNLNDLPMFEVSDIKIAVSNANRELKKEATEIIKSNNEDAVAMYLLNKYNS